MTGLLERMRIFERRKDVRFFGAMQAPDSHLPPRRTDGFVHDDTTTRRHDATTLVSLFLRTFTSCRRVVVPSWRPKA